MLLEKEFWRSSWQRPGGDGGAHALLKKAARKPKNLLKSKDRGKLRKKMKPIVWPFLAFGDGTIQKTFTKK